MENQKKQFEAGKIYRGTSGAGHIDIEVLKRTAKSLVVKTCFGENRVMIKDYHEDRETATFKSWMFDAFDIYTPEQIEQDSYYAAYHS